MENLYIFVIATELHLSTATIVAVRWCFIDCWPFVIIFAGNSWTQAT